MSDIERALLFAEPPMAVDESEMQQTDILSIEVDSVSAVSPENAISPEKLRSLAWQIGERGPAWSYVPTVNHVGLAMVRPGRGFAHWRILDDWVGEVASERGNTWRDCKLILRLYDVTYIEFDGLNAHRIQDHELPSLTGHTFFDLQDQCSSQLAEVGFLLRDGEFVPAARSQHAAFPPAHASSTNDHAALLVADNLQQEQIASLWDQERILYERRKPQMRHPLRIAAFAFESLPSGHDSALAKFVSELAAGLAERGHEVNVFVPTSPDLKTPRDVNGVQYEPLRVELNGTPLDQAIKFSQVAAERLDKLTPFDLLHVHQWMAGMAAWVGTRPTIVSFGSIETLRCNGAPPDSLSRQIRDAERTLASAARCLLCADWLREKLIAEYALDSTRVHAFAMEGRLPNEWEVPLDFGQVKGEIHVGPLDRLMLFVGPLEHAAGADLLVEALPILLQREPGLRVAFVGEGFMRGHLEHLARSSGVSYAVRFLGHLEGPLLSRLMRAAEALVLPSRWRVPMDDAVVDLARRAARPVVTTNGGPAHLVRHEETGLVTYDNPGSMVWAVDRILGDPAHAERMGRTGSYDDGLVVDWSEVATRYLDLCASCVPELLEPAS